VQNRKEHPDIQKHLTNQSQKHTPPPKPTLRFPSLKIIGGGVLAKTLPPLASSQLISGCVSKTNFPKKLASQALIIAIADIEEDKVHVGLSPKNNPPPITPTTH
jgi:hypothetical protein